MTIKKRTRGGYTLIELMVVVALIGILISVVLANVNVARSKGRDAQRLSDIARIQVALELYYHENGVYPSSAWLRSCATGWTTVLGIALSKYLPTMPVDPINDCTGYAYQSPGYHNYSYYADANSTLWYPPGGIPGQWYVLVFKLENQNLKLDQSNYPVDCVGNARNHGGLDGYRITVGGNCK